jgi:hypothetical protein
VLRVWAPNRAPKSGERADHPQKADEKILQNGDFAVSPFARSVVNPRTANDALRVAPRLTFSPLPPHVHPSSRNLPAVAGLHPCFPIPSLTPAQSFGATFKFENGHGQNNNTI